MLAGKELNKSLLWLTSASWTSRETVEKFPVWFFTYTITSHFQWPSQIRLNHESFQCLFPLPFCHSKSSWWVIPLVSMLCLIRHENADLRGLAFKFEKQQAYYEFKCVELFLQRRYSVRCKASNHVCEIIQKSANRWQLPATFNFIIHPEWEENVINTSFLLSLSLSALVMIVC